MGDDRTVRKSSWSMINRHASDVIDESAPFVDRNRIQSEMKLKLANIIQCLMLLLISASRVSACQHNLAQTQPKKSCCVEIQRSCECKPEISDRFTSRFNSHSQFVTVILEDLGGLLQTPCSCEVRSGDPFANPAISTQFQMSVIHKNIVDVCLGIELAASSPYYDTVVRAQKSAPPDLASLRAPPFKG